MLSLTLRVYQAMCYLLSILSQQVSQLFIGGRILIEIHQKGRRKRSFCVEKSLLFRIRFSFVRILLLFGRVLGCCEINVTKINIKKKIKIFNISSGDKVINHFLCYGLLFFKVDTETFGLLSFLVDYRKN